MPNSPIDFRIAQNLQTALRGIRKSAGYHYDVEPEAVKLDPNHDVEKLVGEFAKRPFVVLEMLPDSLTYPEHADSVLVVVPFVIYFIDDANISDDDDLLLTYAKGCADVETAIAADITRGGLAHSTKITTRRLEAAEETIHVWSRIDLEVRHKRTFGGPND